MPRRSEYHRPSAASRTSHASTGSRDVVERSAPSTPRSARARPRAPPAPRACAASRPNSRRGVRPVREIARAHVRRGEALVRRAGRRSRRASGSMQAVDQGALGGEVVEHAALGDAGLGGDGVERERGRAVAPDHGRARRRAARCGGSGAAVSARRRRSSPITPTMISAIEASFSAVAGSPRATMPMTRDRGRPGAGPDRVGGADGDVLQDEAEQPEAERVADDDDRGRERLAEAVGGAQRDRRADLDGDGDGEEGAGGMA